MSCIYRLCCANVVIRERDDTFEGYDRFALRQALSLLLQELEACLMYEESPLVGGTGADVASYFFGPPYGTRLFPGRGAY